MKTKEQLSAELVRWIRDAQAVDGAAASIAYVSAAFAAITAPDADRQFAAALQGECDRAAAALYRLAVDAYTKLAPSERERFRPPERLARIAAAAMVPKLEDEISAESLKGSVRSVRRIIRQRP